MNVDISILDNDTFTQIFQFLRVEEMLMVSLCSKSLYEVVSSVVEGMDVGQPWTISKALLKLKKSNLQSKEDFSSHNLARFRSVSIGRLDDKEARIESYLKEVVPGLTIEVEAADFTFSKELAHPKESEREESVVPTLNFKKHTVPLRVGHAIKNLEIKPEATVSNKRELFSIINSCMNLEKLDILYLREADYDKKPDEEPFTLVKMNRLKKLEYNHISFDEVDNDHGFLAYLLEASPNLKVLNFNYYLSSTPERYLINRLCTFNKKLEKLKLYGEAEDANGITDDSLIKLLKCCNIKSLHLRESDNLDCSFFNVLHVHAPELKTLKFCIQEGINEIEQNKDAKFCGVMNKLRNLEMNGKLVITDKFAESVIEFLPNLKKFECDNDTQDEDTEKNIELIKKHAESNVGIERVKRIRFGEKWIFDEGDEYDEDEEHEDDDELDYEDAIKVETDDEDDDDEEEQYD
ncbi:nitrogen regulatory protein glnB [Acrasis kona]|uniref:Nitrogen regulatory protein glnB n=1 Tax=Acrasis kona TaxID=1008807 RepID=A0AAW2ZQ82_9EUKA